jgi:hypothetical protein
MVIYNFFLGFENYRVLAQNSKGLTFGFTDKRLFTVKMGQKSIFEPREAHILSRLDILVLYIKV